MLINTYFFPICVTNLSMKLVLYLGVVCYILVIIIHHYKHLFTININYSLWKQLTFVPVFRENMLCKEQ